MKRSIDIVNSLIGLVVLSPFFFTIAVLIVCEDGFPIYFRQTRVGKNGKEFKIHKFRTMYKNAEAMGPQITIGSCDPRITKVGHYLRKFKLDELPQLLDVFLGTMSFVGPRPEVPRYVAHYTQEQRIVLQVCPGITDWASIAFRKENDMLEGSQDPEFLYLNEIMPQKIALNIKYIQRNSLLIDLQIVLRTLFAILGMERFLRGCVDENGFWGPYKGKKK